MLKGVLLKGYGGFYYVQVQGDVWECSLRGRFRIKNQTFLPGDHVRILPDHGHTATIEHVYPRTNELSRPSVANVDQVVLVFPLISPKPDYMLLDRILIQAQREGIEAAVVFTKMDLLKGRSDTGEDTRMPEVYKKNGLPVHMLSTVTGEHRSDVQDLLCGKISVLAGPSGAGKSSLLNMVDAGLKLKTGAVSEKIGRGRHTTRHVELLPVMGGLVADTPGFSALYLPAMEKEELQLSFPEIAALRDRCRFSGCLHEHEPNCAVREAVEEGVIARLRYHHYLVFLQEIKKQRKTYKK